MRKALFLFLILLLSVPTMARRIIGRVVDSGFRDLPGATVELLSVKDSSVIRATVTKKVTDWNWEHYQYSLDVDNNTTYLIRASRIGFKPKYKKVTVKMADRVAEQWVEDIQLEEDSKTLSEVVVKATKIKMVMKGDTIVYDATAFNLSEGSMLDALIRQLPGATLDDKGVIKVNGRTVSSLLVDGRDFFSGDAKKAMENLPAYTVDKVKVYDKAGRESRFNERDMGDKELVLDVNLKKQYKQGNISNVDVALGTSDRYQARLFSMLYTKRSRLTVTGNVNNVNNGNVPGEDGGIDDMPETANTGRMAKKQVGLNYRVEGKSEDDYFNTTNTYTYNDNEVVTRTNSQTFLTGGDYYNLNTNGNRAKSYSFSTNNDFGLKSKKSMFWGNAGVNYTRNKGFGNSISGRFSEKPWGMSALDSIFSPNADSYLLNSLINRVRNDSRYKGHTTSYNGSYRQYIRFGTNGQPWEGDNISFSAQGNYTTSTDNRFALNRIDYLTTGSKDYRDQYTESPNKNYDYQAGVEYTHFLINDTTGIHTFFFRPEYNFSQSYSSQDHALYRLDQLADYDSTSYDIGVLPSTREALLSVQDNNNSYWSRLMTHDHQANFLLNYNSGDGIQRPKMRAILRLNTTFRHESLDYYRLRSYGKSRNATLLSPYANFYYQFNDSTGYIITDFSYMSSETQPSLESQLDIRDDANPLAVTIGNPNLKNARNHNVSFSWAKVGIRNQQLLSVNIGYNITQNAIATAMLYDKQTGITTTQQQNVNGNWSLNIGQDYQRPVDKKQRFTLASHFYAAYTNSVDLTTVEGNANTRSDVHNWNLSWRGGAQYQLGDKINISLQPYINYQRATSNRSDFTTVSAWSFIFPLHCNIKLPLNFRLSTDLAYDKVTGYNDDEMNISQWVWNARLSKGFLKNKLTVALDGFDILNQLKSTTFTLNAQGRTEQWTNSLPRYAMFHIAYKFTTGAKRQ